jgi:hypothetical protein
MGAFKANDCPYPPQNNVSDFSHELPFQPLLYNVLISCRKSTHIFILDTFTLRSVTISQRAHFESLRYETGMECSTHVNMDANRIMVGHTERKT